MGGYSLDTQVNPDDFSDPQIKMQVAFRSGYKGKVRRSYDLFLDTDGTRSKFIAYRAVFGGMVVCHTIESEYEPGKNCRMILWYFRRGKSTPIPLDVWAGDAKARFPEGCRDPGMIEMQPNLMQRRYMTTGVWQEPRVPRPYSKPAGLRNGLEPGVIFVDKGIYRDSDTGELYAEVTGKEIAKKFDENHLVVPNVLGGFKILRKQ